MLTKTIMGSALSESPQCRLDSKYLMFTYSDKWKVFKSSLPTIRLSEILKPLPIKKIGKGELDNEALLVNIADQNPGNGVLDMGKINLVDNVGSDKVDLSESNIIISKLGMSRGYIFPCPTNIKHPIIGSSEFIPYKIGNDKQLLYYVYLLLNKKMLQTYARLETGKTPSHRRVNPNELLRIEIPYLCDKKIDCIVPIIYETSDLINKSWDLLQPAQSIIDRVFAREFGFDYEVFEELKTHKRYSVESTVIANNPDLRFSPKFHRGAGEYVMTQLCGITSTKIKHYLAEPIVLGASISPSDYDDNGDYYYISMATIKNWQFDELGANLVSTAYSDSKQVKTVRVNDILVARSGEGTIGKVALIDNPDLQGVFADFTMRIRLKDYNHRFAYYYFRSSYFQYLVEVYKKGLGNNTNIFPIVMREFPIPDISFAEQQRIVDEIQTEIGKQDDIRNKISALRGKIDRIIEDAILAN